VNEHDGGATSDELVTVGAVRTELEAQLLVAALADEGIDAVAFPIGAGVLPMAMPARPNANLVPIQVRTRDANRARAIVAERRAAAAGGGAEGGATGEDSDGVDWDDIDVGERVDALPLGTPGRTPITIRIIALAAIVLLGGSCVIGSVLAISRALDAPAETDADPAPN